VTAGNVVLYPIAIPAFGPGGLWPAELVLEGAEVAGSFLKRS
jgi:hypothetical protein